MVKLAKSAPKCYCHPENSVIQNGTWKKSNYFNYGSKNSVIQCQCHPDDDFGLYCKVSWIIIQMDKTF